MRHGFHLAAALLLASLAASPLRAETSSIDDKRQIASTFIAEKLAVWQKRLNLQDWTVTVVTSRKADLKQGTMGKIKWDKDKKTATIWTVDVADYTLSNEELLKDLEFTVVHELIHLELASLPKSEASRRSEEFAVNRLAEALLALDRR